MGLSFVIILLIIIVTIVWLFLEAKRAKHKTIAILIIFLIIFGFFSISYVFKSKQVDYKSVSGLIDAGKVYFGWLSYAFGNVKTITSDAIKMNWEGNTTGNLKVKK